MPIHLVALSAVLALSMAGCATTEPPPAGNREAGRPAPAPAQPGPALPPRPTVLPMTNVDPCSLLTDAQVRQLGVEAGERYVNQDDMPGPDCRWLNFPERPDRRWIAQPVTNRGAEYALGSTTGAEIVQVQGFSAVQTSSPYGDPRWSCLLFVDTAPGQSLLVSFINESGDDPRMTHERACHAATVGAGLMIHNLRAR
jgi:uncharacterized protein DUF3558